MRAIALLPLALSIGIAAAQTAPAAPKTIKDQAEYNAYIAALSTADPAAKAAAMEAFLQQYPNSIVKPDALGQAMAGYQVVGNTAKVAETAARLLDAEPDNVRALAVLTFIDRGKAAQGDAQAQARLGDLAGRGLKALPQWTNREGLPDVDFARLKLQMTEIFNGSAGFAALQKKDYAVARGFYLSAVQADPANLQDVYQLSIADMEMTPPDPAGFWYAAKACNLAQNNEAARKSIEAYASAKYRHFHGSADGWAELVSASAAQPQPPAGFTVSQAPTPAEIAVQAVRDNDPASMSFSDWEFVLSYRDASAANQDAAAKVWQTIQAIGKNGNAKMKLPVKVISATATSMQAAITDDNQQANKADLDVTLERAPAVVPAPGTTVNVIGHLTDYRLNPVTFVMKDAEIAPQ